MPRFFKLVEVERPTEPEQAVMDALSEVENPFIIVNISDFGITNPVSKNEFLTALKYQLNQLVERKKAGRL